MAEKDSATYWTKPVIVSCIFTFFLFVVYIAVNRLQHTTSPPETNFAAHFKRITDDLCSSDRSILTKTADLKHDVCMCKQGPFYTQRPCAIKIEIHSWEPLVLQFHSAMRDHVEYLKAASANLTMRPVMLASEFGRSWKAPYINSMDGVLPGSSTAAKLIYSEFSKISGMVYPCGHPGCAVVKYNKGGFVGPHYDAPALTVEKSLGYWLGGNLYREVVGSLEDCRHFYRQYNTWQCLYKIMYTGELERSTHWNNYAYGPQIATVMLQLSDLEGGETYFVNLNLTVATKKGDVLMWSNVQDSWQRYENSIHGSCAVRSPEKHVIVFFVPGKCNNFRSLKNNLISTSTLARVCYA